jgi:ankyrin repeat protein
MELPESLDETYERILKEIKKPNRDLARRVLRCLVVATRPLRVAELAEVLVVDFDDAEGIPRLKPDWRWEEQELALLSACSSLIAIVEAGDVKASDSDSDAEANDNASEDEAGGSRIVQFSHFSVKEFLISSRLATASGEVSNYHIDLEPAHTILAQACLGVLLQMQDDVEGCTPEDHPLARYAAMHWTTHAQFGEVSSRLHKGMEYLFDANKPHFEVWLTLWDIDTEPNYGTTYYSFRQHRKSPAVPLYYAALCGFRDLVEHLITKHPQDVNADGGHYVSPLVAALAREHFQTADLLRLNGADPNVRGRWEMTLLHSAANFGILEVTRRLIEYGADINAENKGGYTPLHCVSGGHDLKYGSVLRFLLELGVCVNVRSKNGHTPLHVASFHGMLEVVRLLLEHGADVGAKDNDGKTALQVAAKGGHDEVVELLQENGAKYKAPSL